MNDKMVKVKGLVKNKKKESFTAITFHYFTFTYIIIYGPMYTFIKTRSKKKNARPGESAPLASV